MSYYPFSAVRELERFDNSGYASEVIRHMNFLKNRVCELENELEEAEATIERLEDDLIETNYVPRARE